ncbi:MAG: inosine/xanthosine triphosphatase [Woeseiaceae bacterium]|nr:inosine/xanthosine triphosphatase [Woeseiaceae bacterium]
MKVVVASLNPVKLGAAAKAFAAQFPGETIEIVPVEVGSGVGDQPMSDAATRRGARTRAGNAASAIPVADYWVGMEGGAELLDGQLVAFAWMVVRGADGRGGEARSPTLPLPPAVRDLVADGMELGAANDQVFATANSKQAGGAFGLLTDGRLTRESVYAETLTIALIPLVHPLYRQADPR